jgi:hypothetical protein
MIDNAAAISYCLDRLLEPPDDRPWCDYCDGEPCAALSCAVCGGQHKCEYIDCGEQIFEEREGA